MTFFSMVMTHQQICVCYYTPYYPSLFVAGNIQGSTWVHTVTCKSCTARSRAMLWDLFSVWGPGTSAISTLSTGPPGRPALRRPGVWDTRTSKVRDTSNIAHSIIFSQKFSVICIITVFISKVFILKCISWGTYYLIFLPWP